jgi:hypothetical protein
MDLVNICTTLIYTFPLLFKFPLLMRQKNKEYEFHTRVFVKSRLLWTETERVQAKREPSRGTATTTLTYFVWRCYLLLLESFLTYFALVSWNQSRFRVIASLSVALISVHTITCNLHMYWLTLLSNVPFEDHLIYKLYPHFVETEGLLASKQRDCRLPSLFLELSMQSWETTVSVYVQSFAL